MHALSTPGAKTTSAPPPSHTPAATHRPRRWGWVGHALRPVALAPGWAVGNQGPGWVTLHNALSTAEMEIKVKPSNGTDPVAVLQGDISNLSNVSTTGLTNVRELGAPNPITLQGPNFQQQATVSYSADGSARSGQLPVQGWFVELLNPQQSAFVVFAQNGDAPVRADGDAQAMLDSLQ